MTGRAILGFLGGDPLATELALAAGKHGLRSLDPLVPDLALFAGKGIGIALRDPGRMVLGDCFEDSGSTACPAGDYAPEQAPDGDGNEDAANGGIRQEPELPLHEDIAPPPQPVHGEFDFGDEDTQGDAARLRAAADRRMARNARTASLDPGDGIDL